MSRKNNKGKNPTQNSSTEGDYSIQLPNTPSPVVETNSEPVVENNNNDKSPVWDFTDNTSYPELEPRAMMTPMTAETEPENPIITAPVEDVLQDTTPVKEESMPTEEDPDDAILQPVLDKIHEIENESEDDDIEPDPILENHAVEDSTIMISFGKNLSHKKMEKICEHLDNSNVTYHIQGNEILLSEGFDTQIDAVRRRKQLLARGIKCTIKNP